MLDSQEEVFIELDLILDQLTRNTDVLQKCNTQLCSAEITLLTQAQESLIARFVHTKEYLESRHSLKSKKRERKEKLEEKMRALESLNPTLWSSLCKKLPQSPSLGSRPRIGRNRKKLKTGEFAYCEF